LCAPRASSLTIPDLRKTAGFCDFIVLLTTGTESADFIKNFRNVFQKKKWALGTLT
jgi:hypothetical protein